MTFHQLWCFPLPTPKKKLQKLTFLEIGAKKKCNIQEVCFPSLLGNLPLSSGAWLPTSNLPRGSHMRRSPGPGSRTSSSAGPAGCWSPPAPRRGAAAPSTPSAAPTPRWAGPTAAAPSARGGGRQSPRKCDLMQFGGQWNWGTTTRARAPALTPAHVAVWQKQISGGCCDACDVRTFAKTPNAHQTPIKKKTQTGKLKLWNAAPQGDGALQPLQPRQTEPLLGNGGHGRRPGQRHGPHQSCHRGALDRGNVNHSRRCTWVSSSVPTTSWIIVP